MQQHPSLSLARWTAFLLGCLSSLVAAESEKSATLGQPEEIPPLPAVAAYARNRGIPTDGIETQAPGVTARPGDSITALVTLRERGTPRQWLVTIAVAPLTEEERAKRSDNWVSMTTEGYDLRFSTRSDFALEIRTVGPFPTGGRDPGERSARTLVSSEFLRLGFVDGMKLITTPPPGWNGELSVSQNASVIRSEADARNFTGMFVALAEFLRGIQNTPGLREILWDIAEKPSIWSIARNLGIRQDLNLTNAEILPSAAGIPPDRTLYRFDIDLSLNAVPALRAAMVVASPNPPLLATAGVLGIVAVPPDSQEKRMDIRVLAARRGPPATD